MIANKLHIFLRRKYFVIHSFTLLFRLRRFFIFEIVKVFYFAFVDVFDAFIIYVLDVAFVDVFDFIVIEVLEVIFFAIVCSKALRSSTSDAYRPHPSGHGSILLSARRGT